MVYGTLFQEGELSDVESIEEECVLMFDLFIHDLQ